MGVRTSKTIFLSLLAPCVLLAQGPADAVAQPAADAAAAAPAAVVAPAPTNAVPNPGHTPLPGEPGSLEDKHAFGVLPNYRTAEKETPFSPITTKQKFTIATKDSLDGPSYVLAAGFSGLSQLENSNPSFGQGMKGYARRYGSAIADQDIGNFMTEAIYPTLLHEDPRYFRKGHGSFWGRVAYGATRVFVTRTDAGNWRFNSSEILGNGTAAAIGYLYYPDGRTFTDTMERMWMQIGTDSISGILKEFWPDVKHHFQHRHDHTGNAD
jgi:hypothetical protein